MRKEEDEAMNEVQKKVGEKKKKKIRWGRRGADQRCH